MLPGILRLLPSGPVAGWSLAWGIGAAFLIGSGVSHGWSEGGLAVGLVGAWVALVGSVYLGELVKRVLEPILGWYPGLVLGSGIGGSLGGAMAGVVGRASLGAAYRPGAVR